MPTVLITGANRGIGLELARQLRADPLTAAFGAPPDRYARRQQR